ncbi:gamma subclass chorismate mutase AroQ [Vibrio sagamiensis]|uniref:chorismate mutase n=1 Tax=Vibrio sagamiensis NBRC 104589 TaxID=1219064 RepID=A0A511QAV7_9VIBR|nr:gamma subclass chorismate mutase AroQ [Vibrio sagamiensis]GEM74405.1 chorismate mutase [Vibrio sagamiensis NBRC 104589]
MMKNYLKLLLAWLILLPVSSYADEQAEIIFQIINERMSYMPDVAIYKANHGLPIEDLARESIVLEKAVATSEKYGLEQNSIKTLVKSLMSSAKVIQYRVRADALSQKSQVSAPRELKTVVRPALIKLGDNLNNKLYQYLKSGRFFSDSQYDTFKKAVSNPYLEERDKKMIFDALTKVKLNS